MSRIAREQRHCERYSVSQMQTLGAKDSSTRPASATRPSCPRDRLRCGSGDQNFLAHIEKNVAVAQCELAIQTAFREVSGSLSPRGSYLEQQSAEEALVGADAYRLAEMRFRSGLDSYLATLGARRSLYAGQLGAGRGSAGGARQSGYPLQGTRRRLAAGHDRAFIGVVCEI